MVGSMEDIYLSVKARSNSLLGGQRMLEWIVVLYLAGLSYRRVEQWSDGPVKPCASNIEWYTASNHAPLIARSRRQHQRQSRRRGVYVWAVDMATYEVVHLKVSPRRSDLDALLFLKQVFTRHHEWP